MSKSLQCLNIKCFSHMYSCRLFRTDFPIFPDMDFVWFSVNLKQLFHCDCVFCVPENTVCQKQIWCSSQAGRNICTAREETTWKAKGPWTRLVATVSKAPFMSINYRVCMHLESPWKSLNFKIKIQGLESPWKFQSVLESPWISLRENSKEKGAYTELFMDEITRVVEELKKT